MSRWVVEVRPTQSHLEHGNLPYRGFHPELRPPATDPHETRLPRPHGSAPHAAGPQKTAGGPATSLLGLVPRGVWWRFYDQGEITQQFCGEAVILSYALGEFCVLERVLAFIISWLIHPLTRDRPCDSRQAQAQI